MPATRTNCPASSAFALLLAAMACALTLALSPSPAFADDEGEAPSVEAKWHSHTMNPGETYNIGKAKHNTTVYIKNPGSYYLRGSSSSMHLEISSGNVTLYLEDGLNINAGIYSNVGQCSAGIAIGNQGGTVTICTRAGATAKVSGYLGGAGIQKDGTNTKLVFKTEDTSNPGKLIVKGSNSVEGGAGIGTSSHAMFASRTTGNIVIESGIIEATGYINSAGIGGGDHGTLSGLTINGGTVTAKGGNNIGWVTGGGAGIGGGTMGDGKNITINGGTVTANGGDSSAGIGGGMRSSSTGGEGKSITINSGTVTATGGYGGAGIGGSREADANGIKITGGTVFANGGSGSGCGIGGGGGNFNGTGSNIVISGGQVTATSNNSASGDAVIGSSGTGNGATSVTISGGTVNIQTKASYGIGGGGSKTGALKKGSARVTISGGTVSITSKKQGIGSSHSNTTISIIGGSVFATADRQVVNQSGAKVCATTINLHSAAKGEKITSATIEKAAAGGTEALTPSYGLKDVQTTTSSQGGDQVCFWLPEGYSVTKAASSTTAYVGSVTAGSSGTLHPQAAVTLDANGGQEAGSGTVAIGEKSLDNIEAPQWNGYSITGYSADATGTAMIADANGALKPSVSYNGTTYTDSNGAWAYNGSAVTLYAKWQGNEYTVKFEGNAPADTESVIEGTIPTSQKQVHGTAFTAPDCSSFKLYGYDFHGWNTQADGEGTQYAAGAEIVDLIDENGTATLYAIWRPQTYTVTFKGGDSSGGDSGDSLMQTLTYDKPECLDTCTFTAPTGKPTFLGWKLVGGVGSLWEDRALVCNLCAKDSNGYPSGYTLEAQWVNTGTAYIIATNDTEPLTGEANNITLEEQGGASYSITETSAKGVYSCNLVAQDAPYSIYYNNKDTKKTIAISSSTNVVYLDFCTVEIESAHQDKQDAEVSLTRNADLAFGSSTPTKLEKVLVGTQVSISTTMKSGWGFRGYIALGCDPEWETSQPQSNQTITIKGQTTIIATTGPAQYAVEFDANADNATGSMADQQFTYGKAQALSSNAFIREHRTFACWTLTPEWTGSATETTFKDEEAVKNLADTDDAAVKLYAQWNSDYYWIEFNGNGGNTGFMSKQKVFFDEPTELQDSSMTMEDHRFLGWNTESDGSGTFYADEAEILNLATEDDEVITLWAQWERDFYTVAFDANGAAGSMDRQNVLTHVDDTLEPCAFERNGYTFSGWNTAPDGTGKAFEDVAEITDLADAYETITLYAQWRQNIAPSDPSDNPEGTDADATKKLASTGDRTSRATFATLSTLALLAAAATIVARTRARKQS